MLIKDDCEIRGNIVPGLPDKIEKKCHQQQIYLSGDEEENLNRQNVVYKPEKKKPNKLDHRNHFAMFESEKEGDSVINNGESLIEENEKNDSNEK